MNQSTDAIIFYHNLFIVHSRIQFRRAQKVWRQRQQQQLCRWVVLAVQNYLPLWVVAVLRLDCRRNWSNCDWRRQPKTQKRLYSQSSRSQEKNRKMNQKLLSLANLERMVC